MRDLGTLGGLHSYATAIDAAGRVTGSGQRVDGSYHVFLYSDGGMRDIDTLDANFSQGNAINTAGLVTGYAFMNDGSIHGFLYSDGVTYDLNSLISAGSGWTVNQGFAINDLGQIAGYASLNGVQRAVLLSRVPQTKDDCKGGDWRGLMRVNATPFKNQGDCVSYVNAGK